MRRVRTLGSLLLCVIFATSLFCSAESIELAGWGINLNSTIYQTTGSLPGTVNASGFDFSTGLGTITIYFNPGAAGNYYLAGFLDHEIDQFVNGYWNELGDAVGAPISGQTWEIDEPTGLIGDIWANFNSGTLDNGNNLTTPEDVSLALGWAFPLTGDQHAVLTLHVGTTAPTSGFYLTQWDPDSITDDLPDPNRLYYSGNLSVQGGTTPIPEPATLLLLGSGLLAAIGWNKRRKQ